MKSINTRINFVNSHNGITCSNEYGYIAVTIEQSAEIATNNGEGKII
jgi:hypothetical protein